MNAYADGCRIFMCICDRKCKRKRSTTVEDLPDDVLFEILVRLPAQHLYDGARLVCPKWYRMIHHPYFIHAHLQHNTTYGIHFQSSCSLDHCYIVYRQCQIEKSKLYNFQCPVQVSCNGLVLGYQMLEPCSHYIVNPVTKQYFSLPPFSHPVQCKNLCGLGYVAASMEYKVVVPFCIDPVCQVYEFAILTVGVDESWRNVGTRYHLPVTMTTTSIQITEGFMHWTSYGTEVLSLNLEKEVITETPPPILGVVDNVQAYRKYYYMSTGRYLSLLIVRGEGLFEIWEMKPANGEWTKLTDLDMGAPKCRLVEGLGLKHGDRVVPICWLKYPEVLVLGIFPVSNQFIFYNLVTQDIKSMKAHPFCACDNILLHRNTLVWLDG